MATQLNPGADATLVAAATRAAMANVPKDLSGTFEALARSYDDTMQSVAASWSSTIKDVTALSAPLIKTAIKNNITMGGAAAESYLMDREIAPIGPTEEKDTGKPGWMLTPDPSDDPTGPTPSSKPISIADKLREIRGGLQGLWFKTDKASRIKRHELKSSRSKLFSNLAYLENADNFTNDNLANGLVDMNASGKMSLLMQTALGAYKTKSGKILEEGDYEGYHVSLAEDENDELIFILRNKKGDIVTGEGLDGEILTEKGGKPFSVSTRDMNSLLVTKTDQSVLTAVRSLYEGLLNSDAPTYEETTHRNTMKEFVHDEASLFGLIQHALGSNKTSWVEDLNNPSEESATIFAGMSQAKLAEMKIIDVNNDGFLGDNPNTKDIVETEDFIGTKVATQNYKIAKDSLLNRRSKNYDFTDTQNAFLDYADRVGGNMHKFKNASQINAAIETTKVPTTGYYNTIAAKNISLSSQVNQAKNIQTKDPNAVIRSFDGKSTYKWFPDKVGRKDKTKGRFKFIDLDELGNERVRWRKYDWVLNRETNNQDSKIMDWLDLSNKLNKPNK